MKTSHPKQIAVSLSTVLQELGLGQRIKQVKALDLWKEVVGEQIARVTSPDRIDNGKLVVRVHNAPWRNELLFLKREIIMKLNNALGETIVKDIHFR